MNAKKREKLRQLGYRVIGAKEFLGLTREEMELIDLKVALIEKLKKSRSKRNMTQQQLARLIGSSQSRVAMMEGGLEDASLDLICRALFALGVSRGELGKAITSGRAA